jgi:hypothetical protein
MKFNALIGNGSVEGIDLSIKFNVYECDCMWVINSGVDCEGRELKIIIRKGNDGRVKADRVGLFKHFEKRALKCATILWRFLRLISLFKHSLTRGAITLLTY